MVPKMDLIPGNWCFFLKGCDRKCVAPIILTYKWHHHNTVVLYTVSNSQSEFIIGAVRRIDKLDFHNLCFVIAVSVFLPDLKVVADWLIVALV